MLEVLRAELTKYGAFNEELPDIVHRVAEAIPFPTVPDRMKYTIAVSEIILFASQFRRNIQTWDGSSVPINAVGFVITGSGQNKDSSVNAARRCFTVGYDMIADKRKSLAKRHAIQLAQEAGVQPPYTWETYRQFYRNPNPLFVAPSTTEGFIQHLNDLDIDGIGSGYLYSGEFGAELSTSPTFVDNLKLISEVYDLGNKEVKVLKARENQSKELKGLPVNAFLVGSPINILYDEAVKRKFRAEFSTKLARRSSFCFAPESIQEPTFLDQPDPIEAMLEYEYNNDRIAAEARSAILDGIKYITEVNLAKVGTEIAIDQEVHRLFNVYKRYNNEVADKLPKLYQISMLVRRHLQWKALKLAGAISIFNQHDTVTMEDYVHAIRFYELLDNDMQMFENELVKEPYEVFADYIRSIAKDGKSFITLHTLRKLGYLPLAGGKPEQKMKDLVHLAASYDSTAMYSVTSQGISFEGIEPVKDVVVTYKEIDNSPIFKVIANEGSKDELTKAKQLVAFTAQTELETYSCSFADLGTLLQGDYAYSSFQFTDGIRRKENLLPGTKWLVFDIDDSCITAEEAHMLLEDINHHIALSTNPDNHFKFRVLVELDSIIDIPVLVWKHFYASVAEFLSLKVDPLPQSHLFFSYSTSPVYSTIDGKPIAIRNHLMAAHEKIKEKPTSIKPLTTAQQQLAIEDPFTTFHYAYECPNDGTGSRTLARAAMHAKDLGMSTDEIIDLVYDINDFWTSPMSNDRMESTIIAQIKRL